MYWAERRLVLQDTLKDIFLVSRCHTGSIQHHEVFVVELPGLVRPIETDRADRLAVEDAHLVVHRRRLLGRHANVYAALLQSLDRLRLIRILAWIALRCIEDNGDLDAAFLRGDHRIHDGGFHQREDGDVRRFLGLSEEVNNSLGAVELRVVAGRRAEAEKDAAHCTPRRQGFGWLRCGF